MMRIDDYTKLPLGTKFDTGEVQVCTHCGHLGLAEEVNGKIFFTHMQAVGFNDKGLPELVWKMCPRVPKTILE